MHGNDVWSALLDKHYLISVNRTAPCQGTLTISDAGHLLHREQVSLAYDALFGPDIDDVSYWRQLAVAFVDRRNRQSRITTKGRPG